MSQTKDKLLAIRCGINLKFHIGVLAGKYVTIVENKLAKVTFDGLFTGSYSLTLDLTLVAQSAPINSVNMDKSFVLYYQLKVV